MRSLKYRGDFECNRNPYMAIELSKLGVQTHRKITFVSASRRRSSPVFGRVKTGLRRPVGPRKDGQNRQNLVNSIVIKISAIIFYFSVKAAGEQ